MPGGNGKAGTLTGEQGYNGEHISFAGEFNVQALVYIAVLGHKDNIQVNRNNSCKPERW